MHAQAPVASAAARAETPYLSQEDAAARSARVSNVAYTLDYTLTGEPTFTSTSVIAFDLKDTQSPLTVDLDKATISALTVNGKKIAPVYNQWFITLPASALRVGRNTVSVGFTREHSTNGEGLHRYVDKTDNRVYLYSHFEPAAAHQMFASFDQPDLKATYTLTATAPKDWEVISTARETGIKDQGAMRRWTFPVTPKLSTYNFSMHAGPYKKWEDNSGKYPMRLFARQSVAGAGVAAGLVPLHQAGPGVLRRLLRHRLPVQEIRPDPGAAIHLRRDGERRGRHLHRGRASSVPAR